MVKALTRKDGASTMLLTGNKAITNFKKLEKLQASDHVVPDTEFAAMLTEVDKFWESKVRCVCLDV